jgi:hypothetical protein
MSNLSDLINNITDASKDEQDDIGNLIGTLADISGAIGFIQLVSQLLGTGQPDLSAIQNAIENGFAQLGKVEEGNQILQRNTTLNGYIGPALTQLQTVQAELNANPSPTEVVAFIEPCITALNDLGGNTQPDIVWNITAGWPIYWTDHGQYSSRCDYFDPKESTGGDVGYGPQNPPLNSDGLTVFYYTYSLPLYLFAVSIFLVVAGSLDPKFVTNYAGIIRSAAALLKSRHDQIYQTGLTRLTPGNWAATQLVNISCHGWQPPAPGITLVYGLINDGDSSVPVAAMIEYGAVEKFSGYSSVGDNYQINLVGLNSYADPATFYKFQIRLLKRTKDVYIGVGLRNAWQVIDNLNALVGDPPLSGSNFGDWSFREILGLSNLAPTSAGYSLRALGEFIIGAQPLDTPYTPDATTFSFRTLLTDFPN